MSNKKFKQTHTKAEENKITHTRNTNQNVTSRAIEETVILLRALITLHTLTTTTTRTL